MLHISHGWGQFQQIPKYSLIRGCFVITLMLNDPQTLFPTLSACVPSPSSLMDLGSETAKHCMVSYFCCWGSCSCGSSWLSLWGLTSIRQLNVWLFLLGPSLDHGTPFTMGEARRRSGRELQQGLLGVEFDEFYRSQKLNNKTGRSGSCDERAKRGYHNASERHNESKTERMKPEKV